MSKRKFEDNDTLTDANASAEIKKVASLFKSHTGEELPCGIVHLPINAAADKLQEFCNTFLQREIPVPLAFYVDNVEVTDSLGKYLKNDFNFLEDVVEIIYQPEALFKVRAVTRCTGSLEGF